MTPTDFIPLTRKTYDAAKLVKDHPPRWTLLSLHEGNL